MKMELQLEKEDCTIEINGTQYNGALTATVEVDCTTGESSTIEVEWAECTLTLFGEDGIRQIAVLEFFGVDFLQSLFGEIEEEHLDGDGLL